MIKTCIKCENQIGNKNSSGKCRKCYKTDYEKNYCINRYKTDNSFAQKQIIRTLNYYKDNKKSVLEYRAKYRFVREKTDISFKLANYLRTRLTHAVRNNQKTGSAVKDLGCSVDELKSYLSSKFTDNMTWENYGKWHIDHIMPLSSFDLANRDELLKACHYTNLQPLWAKDNFKKGAK
jgi:hypothetical protein